MFWAGFYTGLRVVDSSGAAYDVVNAEIAHPRSTFGQALARLFDANVRIVTELRPAGRASLEEVRERVRANVSENPEYVEEMTGRSADWWNGMLVTCVDAADVVRKVEAGTRTVNRKSRETAILSELRIRAEALRAREFGELQELPKWQVENTLVADGPVEFTTFCEHQADGSLFVVIQSNAPIYLGGLVVGGSSEGFFVHPNGEQRVATDTEIQDFFS